MKTIVALILIACSIALVTAQQASAGGKGSTKPEAKAEGGGNAKLEAKAGGGGGAKLEAKAGGSVDAKPKAKAGGGGDAKLEAKAGGGGDVKPKAKAGGGGDAKLEAKAGGGGDAKLEAKAGGGGDAKPKAKAGGGGDAKLEAKAGGGGDAKPKAKAEGGGDAKLEAKAKGGGDAKPEAKGVGGAAEKPEIEEKDKKEIDTQALSDKMKAEYKLLPFYFSIIMSKVYKGFQDHTFEEGIKSIHEQVKGSDRIAAYIAVHAIAEAMGKLDSPNMVSLAFLLKEHMKSLEEGSGGLTVANKFKDKLPKSVKNLAFAECLLLRRKAKSEDLYAADVRFNKDAQRRRVFTWIPGKPQNNIHGCWSVDPKKSNGSEIVSALLIKNRNSKEYMYAAKSHLKIDNKRRSVFTWIPGGPDDQSAWIFEPNGEDMYIKSKMFNEYLSTDDNTRWDGKRRVVYTAMSKKKTKDSLWTIASGDEEMPAKE